MRQPRHPHRSLTRSHPTNPLRAETSAVRGRVEVLDVVFLAIGVGFFGFAALYLFACVWVCVSRDCLVCLIAMSFELVLGAVISVGMLGYLVAALLRPEKF